MSAGHFIAQDNVVSLPPIVEPKGINRARGHSARRNTDVVWIDDQSHSTGLASNPVSETSTSFPPSGIP